MQKFFNVSTSISILQGTIKVTVVVLAVLMVMVAGQGETPDLPDIWKVVEDSYDSRLTINFPDLVSVGT